MNGIPVSILHYHERYLNLISNPTLSVVVETTLASVAGEVGSWEVGGEGQTDIIPLISNLSGKLMSNIDQLQGTVQRATDARVNEESLGFPTRWWGFSGDYYLLTLLDLWGGVGWRDPVLLYIGMGFSFHQEKILKCREALWLSHGHKTNQSRGGSRIKKFPESLSSALHPWHDVCIHPPGHQAFYSNSSILSVYASRGSTPNSLRSILPCFFSHCYFSITTFYVRLFLFFVYLSKFARVFAPEPNDVNHIFYRVQWALDQVLGHSNFISMYSIFQVSHVSKEWAYAPAITNVNGHSEEQIV